METLLRTLALSILLFQFQTIQTFDSKSSTEQQVKDRVLELPGQNFNVNFAHYSGYNTVDESSGRTLFYWFIEAVEDPSSKPLLLWLNGGPGCSSIGFGQAEEIGPFHIQPDGKTLYLNPYSWNEVANILFLESPVGAGFSFSNLSGDAANNGDKRTARDSLVFLNKWFERFPQYKGRDFYLAGESYAGHYVPQLTRAIMDFQKSNSRNAISLKGFMVGNALTDDLRDRLGVFQYLWTNGMISDETFKLLNVFCDSVSFISPSPQCAKMVELASQEMGNIDEYSILTPPCTANSSSVNSLLKRLNLIRRVGDGFEYDPCIENRVAAYFNLPEVQKALHVDPTVAPAEWLLCNHIIEDNWKDSESSILPIYHDGIRAGLRIWMFSGNADGILPVTSTRHDIDALNLPTKSPWRAWYDDGQVGGWTQEYEGLTFVTIKGAGHQVPLLKPKLSLILFKAFLSGRSIPTLSESSAFLGIFMNMKLCKTLIMEIPGAELVYMDVSN